MNGSARENLRRLGICLAGGVLLALVIGNQHGTLTDFGVAFRTAVGFPRILVFLSIGVIIYLCITFWPRLVPYIRRPGTGPLAAGLLVVIISQTIMNWYDPLASLQGSAKFNALRSAVDATAGLSAVTVAFFDWLAWALAAAAGALCLIGIIRKQARYGYLAAAVGLIGAVLSFTSRDEVANLDHRIDHALGMYVDILGFLMIMGAALISARSRSEVANPAEFRNRVMTFRPGLPFAAVAIVVGLLALFRDGWFAPLQLNDTFAKAHSDFSGQGLSSVASNYLSWLGWAVFALCAVAAVVSTWLAHRFLAWVGATLAAAGVVLTFLTLHSMTTVGADVAPQYGKTWRNLGAGGYLMCIAFAFFLSATIAVATSQRVARRASGWRQTLPVTSMLEKARTSATAKALLIVAIAIALFYPPTLTGTWQTVLVTEIGPFLLLAIGLNVVVGWAGLLDLGYIAFFEIGAYTTAYLVGALPRKPPEWLHMTPLLTIPFAIAACFTAGILLGAPTLRLRGDYLAIVTLGFGEIIQILAVNNPGKLTGGTQGPTIASPSLHVGPLKVHWGSDDLMYWYLLLAMLVIVVVLFYRLEGSRLGRAWAAVREDEVAAQANGVNTVKVKLLAFAIGASTSALAGTFFAVQVGYFDPTLFSLQTSILIVAYVVFGGMGSLPGAIAGAAVLTWLPQFLKDQVPIEDRQLWIGAIILAMMIFRPAGLLPAKRRKAELEGLDEAISAESYAVPRSGAM